MSEGATLRRRAAEKRGRRSEFLASLFLRLKFYRILARRVRTRVGEIDLVARSFGGVICFVEVKARPDDLQAVEAVARHQQGRIVRAASLYLAARPRLAGAPVRFDIVSVSPFAWPRHLRDAWRPDDVSD